MSMLAGPRRKQKFPADPRNLAWRNDTNNVGQKLMEKMGWTDGKGLGANENGSVEAIKIKLKDDARGVGCSKNYANNWIAHQDDFNSLLMNLKENHGNSNSTGSDTDAGKVQKLEERSKNSKSRVHYMKFAKGKDLSMKSKEDLACVFGWKKSNSAPVTPQAQSKENSDVEEPNKDTQAAHGVVTINTGTSVQDYFAKKMAELKKMRSGLECGAEASPVDHGLNQVHEDQAGSDEGENENARDGKRKKKKKKKRKKKETIQMEEEDFQEDTLVESTLCDERPKRKSKRKCLEDAATVDSGSERGRKGDVCADNTGEMDQPSQEEKKKKKKKHKTKRSKDTEFPSDADVDTKPVLDPTPFHQESDTLSCQEAIDGDGIKMKRKSKSKKKDHKEEQPDLVLESADVDTGIGKNKKRKSIFREELVDSKEEPDRVVGDETEMTEPPRKKKKKKKKNKAQQNDVEREIVLETVGSNKTDHDEEMEKSEKHKSHENDNENRSLPVNEVNAASQKQDKNVKVEDFGFEGSNIADIHGYGIIL